MKTVAMVAKASIAANPKEKVRPYQRHLVHAHVRYLPCTCVRLVLALYVIELYTLPSSILRYDSLSQA